MTHPHQSCDNLIIDGNNLCYINFFANKGASEEDFLGLTFTYTLATIKNIYKLFKPKNIIIAFDSHSWRKEYTKRKDVCVTHKVYKATRKSTLEPSVKKKLEILEKEINALGHILKTATSCLVLKRNLLEGDDLIAGFVHRHRYEKNVIVSSDKDFMQLINHETRLYNPITEEFRILDEYNNDYNYFLFEKCIRGDIGDNVISSYPRLRKTKIQEAFIDDFKKNNIMNHQFEVEDMTSGTIVKYTYKTADLFEENKFLMSLYDQPEEIKELIDHTLDAAELTRSKFGLFEFLKFCSAYNMVNTIKFIEQYTPILNLKYL
jgi:hypothetical protein